jgi:stage III sporulation protein AH
MKTIKANKKKIIVLVSMVLLLVATGLLNFFLNTTTAPPASGGNNTAQPSFFQSVRSDRAALKEAEIDLLREIVETSADQTMVAEATSAKLAVIASMDTEFVIETLIKARGIEEVVVTIGRTAVSVVVAKADLTVEEANQIMFVIIQETDFTPEDIIILPYV